MPLQLLPMPDSEWPLYTAINIAAFKPSGVMSAWFPDGITQKDQEHMLADMRRQSVRHPGRAEYLKVIDTDLPDDDLYQKIVGISQWKIFPKERSEEEMKKEAADEEEAHALYGFPPGSNHEALKDFYAVVEEYQKKHLGRKPCMFLQLLATRPGHGRRGVGAISMKYGCDKADELGLPLYLEGSPDGVGLYKKWGFEVVDVLPYDITTYGADLNYPAMCMKRQPQRYVDGEV